MSREASTSERTEEIVNNLTSPNIQVETYLEVYNDGSWQFIDDIDMSKGINWSEAGKKEKFANFALTPLPGTVNFTVYNENGKYFDGSGTAFANLFDLDTKIRLHAGYILDTATAKTSSINLNDIAGTTVKSFFFHTQHSGGSVVLDSTYTTPTHFTDIWTPLYDSETYDDSFYTKDGYTVQTYDSKVIGLESFDKFTITSNSTKGTIYYRTLDDNQLLDNTELADWTSAGATENGTKEVDFTDIENERFIQIAVVWDGVAWGDSDEISDITVYVNSKFEEIYTSVYYLDKASFTDPKSPTMPVINCSGRDSYKKSIGVDVKYANVNGKDIDDIIKEICDQVGIPYTASSIADLSSFASRTTMTAGNDDVVKAEKLFNQCMQVINTTGYVMYTEYESVTDDNILYVQPRPDLEDTTGAFSYHNYESIGSTSKDAGRSLQRMSVFTDQQSTNDEVQLDTEALTTTGAKSLTWSGTAEYKRIVVDEPDNITISDLSTDLTSISFTVDSISGTVNVTAYGCKYSTDVPDFEGEAIDWDNMTKLDGTTAKELNPLMVSDAECKSVAESFISQFGTPIWQANSLKWPYLNLIPELNDGYMLWRRFVGGTSADDIYIINKVTHHFDKAKSPNHYTLFNLEDSGNDYSDLGDFVYDDIMDYDKGFIYDMGISTPLSTDAEIDAATEIIHNTGF